MWNDLGIFAAKLDSAIADVEAKLREVREAPLSAETAETTARLEHVLALFQQTLANPPSWLL